jgi:thiol-disulfide isomerase/thioredoxin
MHLNRFVLLATLCVACDFAIAAPTDKLDVGSVAPKLNIEHWVHNGGGKFPKVTDFEAGKVYVVEFWATTCGPCVQSMPHLAELQATYADKGLQIISISNESLDVVNKFLKRELPTPSGKTQRISEITQAYCLTTDPDSSSERDYMLAAQQDGIPCAFIVGKDAMIEWIGHPMEMDGILDAVITDKWDRAKYAEEQKLIQEIQRTIGGLAKKKKYAEAIQAIDGFVSRVSDPRLRFGLYKSKIDFQLKTAATESDIVKSYQVLFESCAEEPMFVQDVAWTAYESFVEERMKSKSVLKMSIVALEKTLPKVSGADKANLFDTIARIQAGLGDLDAAIRSQTEAVRLSDGSDQGTFKEYLQEIKNEARSAKK